MVEFYNGDGYWETCSGCGADGLWMLDPDDDDQKTIICECGHEEVID